MLKLIIKISFRYLKSQKNHYLPSLIATISFIGIVISVATLIIVAGVQNGFRTELVKQIIGINAHVSIYNNQGIGNYESLVKQIKITDEVQQVMPVVDGKGMLVNIKTNGSAGAMIKGINKNDLFFKSKSFKSFDVDIDDFDGNVIILGSDLAWSIGAYNGSMVTLISPEINETIFGIVPRSKTYKVVGIANVGISQYNSVMAFVPLPQAQKFFRHGDSISLIEVILKNPENTAEIMYKIENILPNGSQTVSWQQQNGGMLNALNIEKNVMIFILSLFVIVTVFAIFAGLTMMINDKYKSIAILRSMGFTRKNIGWIFFFTGMIIVIFGTFVGATIGLLFSFNIETIKHFLEIIFNIKLFDAAIYGMPGLPSDIHTKDVIYIVVFVLFSGMIASVFPAIKATKCKPGEALKYF